MNYQSLAAPFESPAKNFFFGIFIFVFLLSGCGPKGFVRGEYDDDVRAANLLTDQWSESDMQQAVKDLSRSMKRHPAISNARRPPIVMVSRLENKTNEHIDTQSVMDMLRVEMSRDGRLVFVDVEARDAVAAEYEYQTQSGMVAQDTAKGPGGQVGADFILNGRMESIEQRAGRDKTIYYKITLNLTNLSTNLVVWTDYKEIRKIFRRQRVRL